MGNLLLLDLSADGLGGWQQVLCFVKAEVVEIRPFGPLAARLCTARPLQPRAFSGTGSWDTWGPCPWTYGVHRDNPLQKMVWMVWTAMVWAGPRAPDHALPLAGGSGCGMCKCTWTARSSPACSSSLPPTTSALFGETTWFVLPAAFGLRCCVCWGPKRCAVGVGHCNRCQTDNSFAKTIYSQRIQMFWSRIDARLSGYHYLFSRLELAFRRGVLLLVEFWVDSEPQFLPHCWPARVLLLVRGLSSPAGSPTWFGAEQDEACGLQRFGGIRDKILGWSHQSAHASGRCEGHHDSLGWDGGFSTSTKAGCSQQGEQIEGRLCGWSSTVLCS